MEGSIVPGLWKREQWDPHTYVYREKPPIYGTCKRKFSNKRRIYSIGLYEFFSGILVQVSNCQPFSPFETVNGSTSDQMRTSVDNRAIL